MDHAGTGEERLGAEERGLPHSAVGLGPAPVRYSKFCQMPWLNFGRCGIAFSVASLLRLARRPEQRLQIYTWKELIEGGEDAVL